MLYKKAVIDMEQEKLESLLRKLAKQTEEYVRPTLADDIKQRIPHPLMHHRGGLDTIRIIIDLRVNRLATAAVIILTMFICVNIYRDKSVPLSRLYDDTKVVANFMLGHISADNRISRTEYERLVPEGTKYVYYGQASNPVDGNAVIMHWRIPNGNYRIRFGNLRVKTVSPQELIDIQVQMIQCDTKQ